MIIKEYTFIKQYGVKGMKWGVRRGTKDFTIPKGSSVYRISNNLKDKTYDNKKYISINEDDDAKWEDYLGKRYLARGQYSYRIIYETTKDIKVMDSDTQAKEFEHLMKNKRFAKMADRDIKTFEDKYPQTGSTTDPAEAISRTFVVQSPTSKTFRKHAKRLGYDAVVDTHGTNVSDIPVILFDPDKKLRKKSTTWTKALSDYVINNNLQIPF